VIGGVSTSPTKEEEEEEELCHSLLVYAVSTSNYNPKELKM
jgi:hypothetical protein